MEGYCAKARANVEYAKKCVILGNRSRCDAVIGLLVYLKDGPYWCAGWEETNFSPAHETGWRKRMGQKAKKSLELF